MPRYLNWHPSARRGAQSPRERSSARVRPISKDEARETSRLVDRRLEQAAEFPGKIHRNARMNRTLSVEKPLCAAQREHPVVPDVRVDIQTLSPVEAKAHESGRRH